MTETDLAAAGGYGTRTLSEIAARLPGATAVFRRHKLDFCCGGAARLADAAARKGLPVAEIEAELADIAALGLPPELPEDVPALITLIETRYHAAHRRELPELVRLARRVEAVHAENPDVPRGLAALLGRIGLDLEAHMQKEESILFPLMRNGGHPMIAEPIRAMLAEHDDHGAHLRALEALTHDFTPPEEACATWRALYAGARKFANDLVDHIHAENNVLFPRFLH
jgi:regulator of cell morphogenesis and NO signaling